MITGFFRGHKIYFNPILKKWLYVDDGKMCNNDRPCKKCGKMPSENGHDACIENLPNVTNACCGHGNDENAYVILEYHGKEAAEIIKKIKNGRAIFL